MGKSMTTRILSALERSKDHYGAGSAEAKLALLGRLERAELRSARAVWRLHEVLCFLRAYPDDARLLAQVERMLARFAGRADLRRAREALADTGIAGTAIRYRFFWSTLRWLARRWPDRIEIDRSESEVADKLASVLPLLVTWAEAAALKELDPPAFAAMDRLRARGESAAAFFVRRIDAMPGDAFTREAFHDAIEPTYELKPGPDTPSRTRAKHAAAPMAYQREPLRRARPDLREELGRIYRAVRLASAREGEQLIELARGAMVTRSRDLDAFAYGNARDVRLVDDGGGLGFVADRRHPRAPRADRRDLRLPDPAQRRADRLRRGVRDRALGHDDVQHFRELSRRRGGLHLCPDPGDGAAHVRRRVVQPRSVSARQRQRRSDRLGCLVVLLQAGVQAFDRGRAPPPAPGTGAQARGPGSSFERSDLARSGRVAPVVRFRPFALTKPAADGRTGPARLRQSRGKGGG